MSDFKIGDTIYFVSPLPTIFCCEVEVVDIEQSVEKHVDTDKFISRMKYRLKNKNTLFELSKGSSKGKSVNSEFICLEEFLYAEKSDALHKLSISIKERESKLNRGLSYLNKMLENLRKIKLKQDIGVSKNSIRTKEIDFGFVSKELPDPKLDYFSFKDYNVMSEQFADLNELIDKVKIKTVRAFRASKNSELQFIYYGTIKAKAIFDEDFNFIEMDEYPMETHFNQYSDNLYLSLEDAIEGLIKYVEEKIKVRENLISKLENTKVIAI